MNRAVSLYRAIYRVAGTLPTAELSSNTRVLARGKFEQQRALSDPDETAEALELAETQLDNLEHQCRHLNEQAERERRGVHKFNDVVQ